MNVGVLKLGLRVPGGRRFKSGARNHLDLLLVG